MRSHADSLKSYPAFGPLSVGGEERSGAQGDIARASSAKMQLQKRPGGRGLAGEHIINCSLHHHGASVNAWAGADLDQMVGGADGVFIMLDDDDRVADVAQALERRNHFHVVFGVQSDARLIEHVEHAHQSGADLGGEIDWPEGVNPRAEGLDVVRQTAAEDGGQDGEVLFDLLDERFQLPD